MRRALIPAGTTIAVPVLSCVGAYLLGDYMAMGRLRESVRPPVGSSILLKRDRSERSASEEPFVDLRNGADVHEMIERSLELAGIREWKDDEASDHLYGLVSQLADDEIPAFLERAEQVADLGQRRLLLRAVLMRWAESEPRAAATYAEERLIPQERAGVMKGIIAGWAKTDARAAYEWVEKKSHVEGVSGQLLKTIFHFWAREDLDAAMAAAVKSSDRGSAFYGISSLVNEARHRPAVLAKIAALSDPSQRENAIGQVVINWSVTEPSSAGDWLERIELDTDQRVALERKLARYWSFQDPPASARWLLAHSDEETLSENLASVMSTWAHRDPNAAARWLAEVGLGPETDQAVGKFVGRIVARDPQSAFEWARIISSPEERHRALVDVVSDWAQRDPDAAERYLLDSDLPAAEAESIIREVSREP